MSEILDVIKALADDNRLKIVYGITKYNEICQCQLSKYLGIKEATVSRHISILKKAGVIESLKMSRWKCHTISAKLEPDILKWVKANFKPDDEHMLDKVMKETIDEYEKAKAEYKKKVKKC